MTTKIPSTETLPNIFQTPLGNLGDCLARQLINKEVKPELTADQAHEAITALLAQHIDWASSGVVLDYVNAIVDGIRKWESNRGDIGTPLEERAEYKYTLTDLGNSERLCREYGGIIHYCYDRNLWLVYNGKRWLWDDGEGIVGLAKKTARLIYVEASNQSDEKLRDELAKWAKSSESNMKLKGMIELAKAELAVKIADLDANHYLLNCNNGTIDLVSGKLQPHNPKDLITALIPLDFDASATNPMWGDFLTKVFEGRDDLIRYVQKAAGYSITGNQEEQAFWFCRGDGWNGKTVLTGVILDVLAEYGGEIDPMAFMLDKHTRVGPNEALASLWNKRFVAATEVKTGMTLDVALIKRMTGGESIRCERKFEHGFNFKPTHKLWLSGNHEPHIDDTTNSIWMRLKYIPFMIRISEAERNKTLRSILAKKHGVAILAWLVKGCLLWQSEGLTEPEAVKSATQAYRDNEDVLHDFIEERCLASKAASISVSELYATYVDWAEKNENRPLGKRIFGEKLREKGFSVFVGNRNRKFWSGIRLGTKAEMAANVTFVTSVTHFPQSPQEKIPLIAHLPKTDNKSNICNTLATKELPDCPVCGQNEWTAAPDGMAFLCPCGEILAGGGK